MRIIGGAFRGLKLADVGAGDPAAHLRPTTDRVRESIFNLLVNGGYGDPITDARVLDLFAGTGALGLEALSRGAARVTFVDDGTRARALIRTNAERMRATGACRIFRRDATRLGPNRDGPYGLIFLDPPYGQNLGPPALESARAGGWLAEGALIVWEERSPPVAPPGLVIRDQRRYGDSTVTLLTAGPVTAGANDPSP